ncbi:MAG: ATP-binding protein [Gammaproteobacteria bacterium]|nr:ATP-binding protein [Gammaproteobacteria bacterium]MCW8909627.1 ATP-binding protein [Gammaproteobacteria bacterium]MCW9004245.1 ATP-binding protein [Gammaproteobacteria bacterium]MCW9056856.1 ATP-binding protein [Gammaproteobacteria bacterium]
MKLWIHISLTFVILISLTGIASYAVYNKQIQRSIHESNNKWSNLFSQTLAKVITRDTLEKRTRKIKETLKQVTRNNSELKYLLVVDFDGNILTSSLDEVLPDFLLKKDHKSCQMTDENTYKFNNQLILDSSYSLINKLSAHIHVGIDHSIITKHTSAIQRKTLLIMLGIIITGIGIAIILGKNISKPIELLSGKIEKFGNSGELDETHIETSDREILNLIQSFTEMASQREAHEYALQNYKNKLEILVHKKTQQLEDKIKIQEQTETQLREAVTQAKKASRAKSDFLSHMSHELRTPLNAVLGFAQLINTDKEARTVTKENSQEILDAGQHLLDLVNQLLDLESIESGKTACTLEPVKWNEIIDDCIKYIQPKIEEHSLSIKNDCQDNEYWVIADALRLKQITLNLLSNAVKYNKENGTVTIKIQKIDDKCRLIVSDTGKGISEENHKIVFEPFNRLEETYGNIEGSGVGLTISKHLIELMNGNIDFSSQKGVGSTFWLDLSIYEPIKE